MAVIQGKGKGRGGQAAKGGGGTRGVQWPFDAEHQWARENYHQHVRVKQLSEQSLHDEAKKAIASMSPAEAAKYEQRAQETKKRKQQGKGKRGKRRAAQVL